MADKPWLKKNEWAHREVKCYLGLREFLIVPGLVFALGCAAWMVVPAGKGRLGEAAFFAALALALVALLGHPAVLWGLRRWRYGKSVCRLLTLPGVVGGWFKADIECRLPPGPEPILVRLRNVHGEGKGEKVLWWMEEGLELTHCGRVGARLIVPVRLQIPVDPRQRAIPLQKPGLFGDHTFWFLDVRKKAAGIDFLATFSVPVYDRQYADPAEQRPD